MDEVTELWKVADTLRGPRQWDPLTLIEAIHKRGLNLDTQSFAELLERIGTHGAILVPRPLVSFLTAFAKSLNPSVVLDPFANFGQLITPMSAALPAAEFIGISRNDLDVAIAQRLNADNRIVWRAGDPLVALNDIGSADLIISCPPWGGRTTSRSIDGAAVVDDISSVTIAAACAEHLSRHGACAVVLPPSFWFKNNDRSLRSSLSRLDLGVSALIHIPNGFFSGTSIPSYIVVIDRAAHDKFFVAELSRADEHNAVVLSNLLARRGSADIATGFLVAPDQFAGYGQLQSAQRTHRIVARMGVTKTPMKDIALEINLTKSSDANAFPDRDNAVYLPLIGNSPARTSRGDLTLKAHNYAQIVFDLSKALAQYVAGFFNSELGRGVLESLKSGVTIPKITKQSLTQCDIFLVPLDTQFACIEAESKALNLIDELLTLRNRIWEQPRTARAITTQIDRVNREDSLLAWLETLPFPLASILWAYQVSGDDHKARYEHLLHFFEAMAEFYAIVFWSATRDLRSDRRYPVGQKQPFGNSLEHSSFGAWVELAGRLAKFGRSLLNSGEDDKLAISAAFGQAPSDLLRTLFAGDIIEYLQKANHTRNKTIGHGGIVSSEEAYNRRVLLESFLANVRGVVGDSWSRYELMKAGPARIKQGLFHYEAERVMGRSAPFEKIEVQTTNAVEDGALFLLADGSKQALELEPLLVVGPSPQHAVNACYFYNSTDGRESRFISYHFAEDAELRRSDDRVTAALSNLIATVKG